LSLLAASCLIFLRSVCVFASTWPEALKPFLGPVASGFLFGECPRASGDRRWWESLHFNVLVVVNVVVAVVVDVFS